MLDGGAMKKSREVHRCPRCGLIMLYYYRRLPDSTTDYEYAWTCPECRHVERAQEQDKQ